MRPSLCYGWQQPRRETDHRQQETETSEHSDVNLPRLHLCGHTRSTAHELCRTMCPDMHTNFSLAALSMCPGWDSNRPPCGQLPGSTGAGDNRTVPGEAARLLHLEPTKVSCWFTTALIFFPAGQIASLGGVGGLG